MTLLLSVISSVSSAVLDTGLCQAAYQAAFAGCMQGPGTSTAQSEELQVAAARLLAAQAMVREGSMAGAARHGPVAGWPSPSSSDEPIVLPATSKKVNNTDIVSFVLPAPNSKPAHE